MQHIDTIPAQQCIRALLCMTIPYKQAQAEASRLRLRGSTLALNGRRGSKGHESMQRAMLHSTCGPNGAHVLAGGVMEL